MSASPPLPPRREVQGECGFGAVGLALGSNLQSWTIAKRLVVVDVLVARGDRKDALGEEVALRVNDDVSVAGIGDGSIQSIDEPQPPVDLSKRQHSCVGRQTIACEIGLRFLATDIGKPRSIRACTVS